MFLGHGIQIPKNFLHYSKDQVSIPAISHNLKVDTELFQESVDMGDVQVIEDLPARIRKKFQVFNQSKVQDILILFFIVLFDGLELLFGV